MIDLTLPGTPTARVLTLAADPVLSVLTQTAAPAALDLTTALTHGREFSSEFSIDFQ